jgi:A/G-specific adenine glycosylase
MPWRGHPDPYAVWVSEIMLQQTQVDTVRPYFTRFMETFPTLSSLANANDDALLKSWEGLGYYTRVRNLRKAAQEVIANHKGVLPTSAKELQTLPGIGPYSAAAIASIAFGEPVPVVDGNVCRVFARFRLLNDNFKKEAPRRDLAQWLTPHILAAHASSDFNQAMMELGALICTPRAPQCEKCPLQSECQAFAKQQQGEYPKVEETKKLPTRTRNVLFIKNTAGEILLAPHQGERLLKGFWELPERTALPALKRCKKYYTYKQTFSHFHLTLHVYTHPVIDIPPPDGRLWVSFPTTLPLTTATRKILAHIEA